MKTGTYKKTDKGIVEISNNNSTLEVKDDMAVLLDEYQTIFNLIDKGSNVISFVKTSEHQDSLLDSLQIAIAKLLNTKEYINHVNIRGLLRQALYNRTIDNIRHEGTYLTFREDYSEYCQDSAYGVTKQYLNEMMLSVKEILTVSEYQIFKLYHVKDLTYQDIADKLDSNISDVYRQVKWINHKIAGKDNPLNLKCLYDERYVAYQSQGKKRQHKRKVLTQKEIIELCDKPYKLALDKYKESEKFKPENIPANKALQFPTINYFPVKRNDFGLVNETKEEIEYVSTLAYTGSYLPYEVKGYSSKEYRRKRYVRQYQRTLPYGDNPDTFELFKGHKSYLYSDGIQGV